MSHLEIEDHAANPLSGVLKRITGTFRVARKGGAVVARQVPPTVKAAQAGTVTASHAIQRMSDSTLRWLAVSSLGLGAGLYISGKRRLTVAAGMAPALVAGATMALRHGGAPERANSNGDRPAEA